jgi:hypothetical protein
MPRIYTVIVAAVAIAALYATGAAAEDKPAGDSLGIADVLKSGWEVAGYASNTDHRSTFILFRKPGENYLVQCLAGYDVTRAPRIFRNCYELR